MLQCADASLDDDGTIAERQPEIVQRIELQREARFDLGTAATDFLDRHRLKDHHFAAKLAEDGNTFGVALVVGTPHLRRNIAQRPS